jgi:hypothetical protein
MASTVQLASHPADAFADGLDELRIAPLPDPGLANDPAIRWVR